MRNAIRALIVVVLLSFFVCSALAQGTTAPTQPASSHKCELGLAGRHLIRGLWRQKDLGASKGSSTRSLLRMVVLVRIAFATK